MPKATISQKSQPQAHPSREGKLLLVCEDAEYLRDCCSSLRENGYETACSASFAEAAGSVEQEAFDLIIVAQGSPAFEGRAVLERAIEKDRHTRILVLTRAVDMNSYLEAMQLGAWDYLEKPTDASKVAQLVKMHLHPASPKHEARGGR